MLAGESDDDECDDAGDDDDNDDDGKYSDFSDGRN